MVAVLEREEREHRGGGRPHEQEAVAVGHEVAQARDGADLAGWVPYVRAASEAGMVGALADWFAVTALFRHPLGLPIPHTALIKRKKDQIGDQLGGFIEENFMVPALIEERATALELPRRMSTWFADPANAERAAAKVRGARLGNVQVVSVQAGGKILRRVRLGPLKDAAEADALTPKLRALGLGEVKVSIDN